MSVPPMGQASYNDAMTTTPRKLRDIFPTKPCTRCGGSGHYSYNPIDGTRCFGCNGSGLMFANRRVSEAVAAYQLAKKRAKERQAKDLEVGVMVNNRLAWRNESGMTWQTVTAIETTDEVCGWSTAPDGTRTHITYYMIVTLTDGSVHRVDGDQIVRTHSSGVDVAPYLEMAGMKPTRPAATSAEDVLAWIEA